MAKTGNETFASSQAVANDVTTLVQKKVTQPHEEMGLSSHAETQAKNPFVSHLKLQCVKYHH